MFQHDEFKTMSIAKQPLLEMLQDPCKGNLDIRVCRYEFMPQRSFRSASDNMLVKHKMLKVRRSGRATTSTNRRQVTMTNDHKPQAGSSCVESLWMVYTAMHMILGSLS